MRRWCVGLGVAGMALACGVTLEGVDTPDTEAGTDGSDAGVDVMTTSDGPIDGDANVPCTIDMPFGDPVRVMGLDTPDGSVDRWPHLTADETEIFFGRNPVSSDNVVFMRAVRSDRVGAFKGVGAPTVRGDDAGLVAHPNVSRDGKVLPFTGRANPTADLELWIADRVGDSFEGARRIPNIGSPLNDAQPVIGSITGDLWFNRYESAGLGRIMHAPAVNKYVPDGGAWAEADEGLAALPGVADGYPVLSADELTLYFGANLQGGDVDIFVATRTSTAAQFGNRKKIDSLSVSGSRDAPGFVSADNCRLYFDAERGGTTAVWVAERKR